MSTSARVDDWTPLPGGVSWKHAPWFCFRISLLELEDWFGPPQVVDADSGGMGPIDIWAGRFSCGLEIVLWAYRIDASGRPVAASERGFVEMHSSDQNVEHLEVHLPFALDDLSFWGSNARRSAPGAFWLVRQDDHGNTFDVASFSTECGAAAALRSFEARGHKQTYWIERRSPAP